MKKNILFLILILVLAIFFRTWKIEEIPPGLYPDSAIYANEAWLSLKNKDFKVFYPENNGREGLFMWLLALSFYLFGVSTFSLRIVPAILGSLTVFGVYLLAKELFEKEKIALLSSFFISVSFWHTHFSRLGFRVILLPFVITFSLYFLLKSLKQKSILFSILSGLFFGLGFYTYTSFRMAVLILPFLFLFWFLIAKKEGWQKKFLSLTFLFFVTTFFVALPIGIYFLKNPQDFISRATPILVFEAENPTKEFLKSLILHLGMFNFYGDPNWRHNFSGKPMLFFPVGILFLIGFFISIAKITNFLKNKNFSPEVVSYWLLFVGFFVMLLPGILTREGIPHSLRVSGVIPFVFIFAGLGGNWVYQKLKKLTKNESLLKVFSFCFLIFVTIFEFQKYFFVFAKKPEVKSEFTKEYLEMGNYLNSLPEDFEKYVIVNRDGVPISWAGNIPMPAQSIMFLEISKYGKIKSNYLLPKDIEKIKIEKRGIILPMGFDEKIFEKLKEIFPEGQIKKVNEFYVFEVQK
jgi:4-amino-4-deoxy-L-arabinose transferase-like glycosyltransferase